MYNEGYTKFVNFMTLGFLVLGRDHMPHMSLHWGIESTKI